jgi:hypothetical protein
MPSWQRPGGTARGSLPYSFALTDRSRALNAASARLARGGSSPKRRGTGLPPDSGLVWGAAGRAPCLQGRPPYRFRLLDDRAAVVSTPTSCGVASLRRWNWTSWEPALPLKLVKTSGVISTGGQVQQTLTTSGDNPNRVVQSVSSVAPVRFRHRLLARRRPLPPCQSRTSYGALSQPEDGAVVTAGR